jgi:uncharacterized protein
VSDYYLDASALVKRYVDEVGSNWLRQLVDPLLDSTVYISQMAIVEVISALTRRMREGSVMPQDFAALRDALWGDCFREYSIIPPSQALVESACVLLERHQLRAYDAVHLATALSVQQYLDTEGHPPLIFVSADEQLNRASVSEGLETKDPNLYPP